MQSDFGFMLKGFLQLANLILKIAQVLIELFLFLLEFLSVKLLTLSGVKPMSLLVKSLYGSVHENIRRLPIPQQPFLLLQLLLLLLVRCLKDQRVDIGEASLCGNFKARVLLPYAIPADVASWRRRTIAWTPNGD